MKLEMKKISKEKCSKCHQNFNEDGGGWIDREFFCSSDIESGRTNFRIKNKFKGQYGRCRTCGSPTTFLNPLSCEEHKK